MYTKSTKSQDYSVHTQMSVLSSIDEFVSTVKSSGALYNIEHLSAAKSYILEREKKSPSTFSPNCQKHMKASVNSYTKTRHKFF